MIRSIFTILLAAVAVPAAVAGTPLLPALSEHEIATGEFTQRRYLPALTRPIVSHGRFVYHADKGLLWAVREPVASRLVIDERGVRRNGKRVEAGAVLTMVRPIFRGVFGGQTDVLRRHFRIERETAGDRWRLRLKPKGEDPTVGIAAIVITGGATPRHLLVRIAGGGRIELTFDNITHPEHLGDSAARAFAGGE